MVRHLFACAFMFRFACGCCPDVPVLPDHAVHSAFVIDSHSPTYPRDALDLQITVLENCPAGLPRRFISAPPIFSKVISSRPGYVLQFDFESKVPFWVAEKVIPSHLSGSVTTTRPHDDLDPDLMKAFLAGPTLTKPGRSDYEPLACLYPPLMLASPDNQTTDAAAKENTYRVSNLAPQATGAQRTAWKNLERRIRQRATNIGETYVISGTLVTNADEAVPPFLGVGTIGSGAVNIPTHLFKIVSFVGADGQLHATAYAFLNTHQSHVHDLGDFRVKLEWLESRSGFSFFPALTPAQRVTLEVGDPFAYLPATLAPGASRTVSVNAASYWFHTQTVLEPGATYSFHVPPDLTWSDWFQPATAEGYSSWALFYAAPFRRSAFNPWFKLMGSLDERSDNTFAIGTCTRSYEPPHRGELVCFANDVPLMYFNNSGSLPLTITRTR